jgi:alcohol dehydrogenase
MAAAHLADHLHWLLHQTKMPLALKDCGVQEQDLPALAAEAATQWTAQFNPRPVNPSDFQQIFAAALSS